MPSTPPKRPELLAPAGDFQCARAAVENGADAIYFGLQTGMNARSRAVNFALDELPALMDFLHLRGVQGYVTLNTLVYEGEWRALETAIRALVSAGVDAALVQDIGAARFIRGLAPDFELHASTQMSLSSAEGIPVAQSLGIKRVVLARETSLEEIARIRAATNVELEVFVHGALCMSYSGQCGASFAMGGRSSNRGECAQACRLPYELVCDDETIEMGDRKFLMSPQDLASYDLLPELLAAGVDVLKIEGRLKSPEYVAAATQQYRTAISEAMAGRRVQLASKQLIQLESPFSRGFSHGWMNGPGRGLVNAATSAKRGVPIGTVVSLGNERVGIELNEPIRRGDGVAFEAGDGDAAQGGRVYEIFAGRESLKEAANGRVELAFGWGDIDFERLHVGQALWKTHDPQVERELRKSFSGADAHRRVPVDLIVEAYVGQPLQVTARIERELKSAGQSPITCRVASLQPLEVARKHAVTSDVLREQLGRLGGSVYELRTLEATIVGGPMVPLSVLGQLRHEMIAKLDEFSKSKPVPRLADAAPEVERVFTDLISPINGQAASKFDAQPSWHVLCRSIVQLQAVLDAGVRSVMVDFAELGGYGAAVKLAHAHGAEIFLATPRMQKPAEAPLMRRIARFGAEGLLVRNLGGLAYCSAEKIPFVADWSLNAVNAWSVADLVERGACRVTAAYDIEAERLMELAEATRWSPLEVVVYQHLQLFHTEHCLFFSEVCRAGLPDLPPVYDTDEFLQRKKNCGLACRKHDVRLRDRKGVEHPLRADACCRNTLFHGEAQDTLNLVPELMRRGVRHFRIELLDDVPEKLISLARSFRS
jgi:putative protease